jgi:phage protein D
LREHPQPSKLEIGISLTEQFKIIPWTVCIKRRKKKKKKKKRRRRRRRRRREEEEGRKEKNKKLCL